MFDHIKIIFLDVDGVFTDGSKVFCEDGSIPFKVYNDKDLSALHMVRKYFEVIFISGDERVNKNMAKSRNIPFIHEWRDKKEAMMEVLIDRGVSLAEVVYVGDDVLDLECIKTVPLSMCPSDAIIDVKQNAAIILHAKGGDGVIAELYWMIKRWMNKKKRGFDENYC